MMICLSTIRAKLKRYYCMKLSDLKYKPKPGYARSGGDGLLLLMMADYTDCDQKDEE